MLWPIGTGQPLSLMFGSSHRQRYYAGGFFVGVTPQRYDVLEIVGVHIALEKYSSLEILICVFIAFPVALQCPFAINVDYAGDGALLCVRWIR